jgi:hypothetical protein
VNATLSRQYDTGRAAGVLERARSLQASGGPIAVTAALAGMERALRAGTADGAERAAHRLAEAVRASCGDDDAAYVRGEGGGTR